MMEAYYYTRLSKAHQSVYYAMLQGLTNLETEFQIPGANGQTLSDIFMQLRLDHPEIFWATGFRYRFYPDSPNVIFLPEYMFDKGKIREHQKAMRVRVEKLTRPARELSPREKEKYIHDFICENVRYDKLKKPYSHEIIGPLGQGVGVCEGIAKAVKALCDALGLWSMIAISGNNPEKGIRYRHTWNVIQLDGEYYHLDATFDSSLRKSGQIRYDYFNLSDKQIFRDHEPLIAPAPSCGNGDRFYYREKKLSFTKEEDVYNRALQAAKKGKPLVFHWRGGYLTGTVMTTLFELLQRAGAEKQKTPQVSVNWSQAVISVSYLCEDQPPSLLTDEANEGEQE